MRLRTQPPVLNRKLYKATREKQPMLDYLGVPEERANISLSYFDANDHHVCLNELEQIGYIE